MVELEIQDVEFAELGHALVSKIPIEPQCIEHYNPTFRPRSGQLYSPSKMPSLSQRLRKLQTKLLAIRLGSGALILPKEVKRIHMRFATRIEGGHMGPRYNLPPSSAPSSPNDLMKCA